MSSPSAGVLASWLAEPLLMNMHLLANPGDSLLLQHTLDRLLRWLCPSLHIFHVSERACPLRDYARSRVCPVTGYYPSLAVTIFLHEAFGEERILRVSDFLQRPPWQYHHTERCGSRTAGDVVHIGSSASPADALLRPYLLPSRDFYSLGPGMPVWGVRPVHCGGEMLRVTLYSCYDNFDDMVRLYETVLQRHAEEQKIGFCWFTLHMEPGLCLQLALKQLSPGLRVEPCGSAVLQFRVEEIGQLVPLLPNPCSPISTTRWQTEDLDGNKILFQVKAPVHPQRPLTCAFPLTCPSVSPRGLLRSPGSRPTGSRPRSDPGLEKLSAGQRCRAESMGSDSCCSTPPGSSCYSSQRSSPALLSVNPHQSPTRPSLSLSRLRLEEEPETNVDTGVPVTLRSEADIVLEINSDTGVSATPRSKRPAAVGASALETLARELNECLAGTAPPGACSTRGSTGYEAGSPVRDGRHSRTSADGHLRDITAADPAANTLPPHTHNYETLTNTLPPRTHNYEKLTNTLPPHTQNYETLTSTPHTHNYETLDEFFI